MDQQERPTGVPGGGRALVPGDQGSDADQLLRGVEQDLDQLAGLSTEQQVPAFDRMHTALADALARTADTGGPSAPGEAGA